MKAGGDFLLYQPQIPPAFLPLQNVVARPGGTAFSRQRQQSV
jgi:hypothetical protein